MGFLTQRVERGDLEAGDHIYTWRTLVFAYSHHGIYIGDDKVVHFTLNPNSNSGGSTSFCSSSSVPKMAATCLDFEYCGLNKHESGVINSCLNCFLGDGSLYRYQYGVSRLTLVTKLRGGTCTTAKSDPPKDVIHRAMYLLEKGYGKYDVLLNNCEDFALYCKTELVGFGWDGGDQGSCSGQAGSFVGVPVSLVLSLGSKIFSSNPLVYGATAAATYAYGRYANDVGVTNSVRKVPVEELVALHHNLHAGEDARADGADKDCPIEGKKGFQALMAERDRLHESLKLQSLELEAVKKLNTELVAEKAELIMEVLKVKREEESVSLKLGVSTIVNLILIPIVVALYCGCVTSIASVVEVFSSILIGMLMALVLLK